MKPPEESSELPGIGSSPRTRSNLKCCSLPRIEGAEAESGEEFVPEPIEGGDGLTDISRKSSDDTEEGEQGGTGDRESTPKGGLPNSWRGSMRKELIDLSPLVPGDDQGHVDVSKAPREEVWGKMLTESYFGDTEESTDSEEERDKQWQLSDINMEDNRQQQQSPSPRALRVDTRRGPMEVDIVPVSIVGNTMCHSRDREERDQQEEMVEDEREEEKDGAAERAESNSPRTPRGQRESDEVHSIVPSEETISNSNAEESGDTREEGQPCERGDQTKNNREVGGGESEELSGGLLQGRTLYQYRSGPRKPTIATQTLVPNTTLESKRVKQQERVKKVTFYRRRHKEKVQNRMWKAARKRKENEASERSKRREISVVSWKTEEKEVKPSTKESKTNKMNDQKFGKSMAEIISQSVADAKASGQVKDQAESQAVAGPSKEAEKDKNDLSQELEKLTKELLPTQSSEEDESMSSQASGQGKRKARKPRKELKCEVDGCGFTATWKAKMDTHRKKAHKMKTPKKTPRNTPVTSPEGAARTPRTASKRKAERSPSGEVSTKKLKAIIRDQLEKAEKGEKEKKKEKEMEVKGKPTTRSNDSENLAEAYRKIEEKDRMIGQMDQEIIEARAMVASLEMTLKDEKKEKDNWMANCRAIMDMTEKGEDTGLLGDQTARVRAMEKKITELKEEAAKWKGITTAQYAALTDVTKKSLENAERIKFLQSQKPCRDYLKGHCKRGKECKYSHGDVNTMLRAGLRGNMNTEGNIGSPRAVSGKEYCRHFESGYCKYGSDCWKEHDPTRYGSRPRSGSHGNQGFRGPAKPSPVVLGGIQEYPEMKEPAEGKDVRDARIREMEELSKKYGPTEKAMINQMNFLVENQLIPEGGLVEEVRRRLAPQRQVPQGF